MSSNRKTSRKLLASAALLAGAAGVAGLGTYGAFTSTTSASAAVAAGTVKVELGGTSGVNRLSVAATGLVPGDTVQRALTLVNSGSQDLNGVALTTSALPSSKLDTDQTNGLQVAIDSCSVPWTEAGTAPAYTYTCSGTTKSVLTSRAILGSNMALGNLASTGAAKSDNLRVTMTFPTTADDTFQGLSSTVNFSFTATQRTGSNK